MAEPAAAPLLECREVTKRFGALAAVDGLSFRLLPGEILGIGGPNGAGKTTLFEVVSGLNPATSGSVLFEGADITRASPEAICHAGIARTFQLNAAFDSLTVRDNVRVAAYFGRDRRWWPGLRLGGATEAAADEALETVGLVGKDRSIAGALPVLDRKLLMLAGALATRPKLLLMDEPVGGLSPGEIDLMQAAVRRVAAAGVAVVLIEHVMRFLVQLSTRVLIMHHGESIYEGPPEGLVEDRTVVDVYLGEGASRRLAATLEEQARA
ncbi:amino acid/amide ABC transporter ATP-binding protein 1, HAAT family [Tistlia consotensis]|uniref:Amino acid/amide ABC transporter ATP-binding protein 1, HAAT family n=1 Tax=Tistlia consotensis USBA 355 TaxID=560819 RepID=A0A1Y6CI94_9PROT|nr:ATP-binding cassette domain-containing protein [Tistlia consotensis]SMF55765.1 amino acid/amide ABC transporter ATP-binding protein 1, HAAT family [Tistlia consotensis USBA 355]SNR89221.1 amino acid/amide ABC transporter ATP-binding protein 1, HAAT family [Tistlia consotensis]